MSLYGKIDGFLARSGMNRYQKHAPRSNHLTKVGILLSSDIISYNIFMKEVKKMEAVIKIKGILEP